MPGREGSQGFQLVGCDILLEWMLKVFPLAVSNTFSNGFILIARLAQWIWGECVRTLIYGVIYEFDYKFGNSVFATETLMLVTSHAQEINDHFNSNTLADTWHTWHGPAWLPTIVSCHHFKLYHLASVSSCFAEELHPSASLSHSLFWELYSYSKINWSQKATSLLQYSWDQAQAINLIMRTEKKKEGIWTLLLALSPLFAEI